jgi:hypothetical protein
MTGALVNNTNSVITALAVTQSGAGYAATFMGGNVGIGTTSPTGIFEVQGGTAAASTHGRSIILKGEDGGSGGDTGGGNIILNAGTPTNWNHEGKVRISSNRTVGIVALGSSTQGTWISGNSTQSILGQNYYMDVYGTTRSLTANPFGAYEVNNGNLRFIAESSGADFTSVSPTPKMVVETSGNVGIGTTTPRTSLDINGVISGPPVTADDGDAFINFATSNTRFTTANCQAFRLDNLKDGANYTFVVKGTTSTTCSFTGWTGVGTGTSLTVRLPPDHAATVAGTHTVYSFFVAGTDVYMSWVSGL